MKKIVSYIMTVALVLGMLFAPTMKVDAAATTISVSSTSVKIGETVKITVSIPSGMNATIDLVYPTGMFSYVTANGDAGDNGGRVTMVLGEYMTGSKSITVTLKAKGQGTDAIRAEVVNAYDNGGITQDLSGASVSMTVKNEATPDSSLSGDNSLSSLKISPGTLSPAFSGNNRKYTATVDNNVKSIAITAIPNHGKAKVESVSGNSNLEVGKNTISIVVVAENGVKSTYKIEVTRLEEGQSAGLGRPQENTGDGVADSFLYGGQKHTYVDKIEEENIPEGFEVTSMVVGGEEKEVLSFLKGSLTLMCLQNEEGNVRLFVYDEVEKNVYPFVKLLSENGYVVALRPSVDMIPEGYKECMLSIEGKGNIVAYQKIATEEEEKEETKTGMLGAMVCYAAEPVESDYYLLYCLNSNGEAGWYLYDSVEGTYQRYAAMLTEEPEEEFEEEGASDLEIENEELLRKQRVMEYIIIGLMAAAAALLIGLIIACVVAARRKKKMPSDANELAEDDDLEILERELMGLPAGESRKAVQEAPVNKELQSENAEDVPVKEVKKEDDFDVEVSLNDSFPEDEGDYEDEDLTIIKF